MKPVPSLTKAQVAEGFAGWERFPADELELFQRTGTVRKARLPDGAWFKAGPSPYAGAGERIHGLDWHCQVTAGVTGPGEGVRIDPWVPHPQDGPLKLPNQESDPFDVVEVIDPPAWISGPSAADGPRSR